MRIFNMDSALMKFLNMAADIMIISGLWLVGCVPVITVGNSTAAAYYVLTRRISNRESYIVKDFFKAYKANMRSAVMVFLTLAAVFYITWFNSHNSAIYGSAQIIALPLNLLIAIEAGLVYIHVFPLVSRFDMKYKALIKTAFIIANRHLPTSVLHVVLLASILFACYIYPLFLLLAFGVYCLLSSYMLIRIYRKYMPEIDKSTDEI